MKQYLDYAAPKPTNHALRIAAAVSAAVIIPVPVYGLCALEFVKEPPPPGNGYILTSETRLILVVIIAGAVIVWFLAIIHLLGKWLRRKSPTRAAR